VFPGGAPFADGKTLEPNADERRAIMAYAPLVPFSRVPLLFAIGEAKEHVFADGRVAVGMAMKVNATMDHRVIDGFHAARIAKVLREWMENPEVHFDRPEASSTLPAQSDPAAT
jgi:2-oxoacid dehydrogenases acyltransferase (catalytic domain)